MKLNQLATSTKQTFSNTFCEVNNSLFLVVTGVT